MTHPPPPREKVEAPSGERLLVDWCLSLVARYLVRHGHRLTQAGGSLDNLFVSLEEARTVLRGGAGRDVAGELGLPAPTEEDLKFPSAPLATELGRRLSLSEHELRVVVALAVPAISVDVARLYAFSWADFARKAPTVAFVAELLADTPDDVPHVRRLLGSDGALVRAGVVQAAGDGPWAGTSPAIERVVAVPEEVIEALTQECAPLQAGPLPSLDDLVLPSETPHRLRELVGRIERQPSCVWLHGPRSAGRRTAWAAALGERGLQPHVVVLDPAATPEGIALAVRRGALRARLAAAVPLFRLDDLGERSAVAAALASMTQVPWSFAVTAGTGPGVHAATLALAGSVQFRAPPLAGQRLLWGGALAGRGIPVVPGLPRRLASTYRMLPGVVEQVAKSIAAARDLADPTPLDVAGVLPHLQQGVPHALGQLGTRVRTSMGWGDLVVPPATRLQLEELVLHARHRLEVLEDWGLSRFVGQSRGLAALFAGPSGTGKTLAGALIGHELGCAVYRVDLGSVVSKWVGETEKNLSRLFEEAERAQAILLFDEADSLFARRTEIRTANDRYGNMEVNHLLQRMEAYEGVSILTSNFQGGIDEAFARRLRFIVHFPAPDEAARAALWRSMVAACPRVDPDLDLDALAREHRLTGGEIRNVVLRAAHHAAAAALPVDHDGLARAVRAEMLGAGRL